MDIVPDDEVVFKSDLHGLGGDSGPKVDVAPLTPGFTRLLPFRTDRPVGVENESRIMAVLQLLTVLHLDARGIT
eukprot:CAMPEP_0197547356 /NCGR_PEP_ID=MMETSP1320-20131121/1734_1 /TAXON_ID=91990 /ORGANISM="Bolidomonas sp., Strain RCC2347" /LENGTH=73 /DNA_ID=CAMNT_0043107135 /DNA_START=71 /DNA_END=289 /DNA_ORIENTATION=+